MHVATPDFGDSIELLKSLRDTLRVSPVLVATDARLLAQERYETTYGIFDHDAQGDTRPLALVEMQEPEDSLTGSLLYERMEQYLDCDVLKYFGLSLDAFLALPTDMCLKIMEMSAKQKKATGAQVNTVLQDLENLTRT